MTSNATTNRPLRFGLVGTGIGRLHAAGIARLPGEAQLAAVCSLDLSAAQSIAAEYGGESVTDCFEDLLNDKSIDVIDLCVPPNVHLPMAIAASEAGKHILVEKPIARNLAEADKILETAKANNIRLMVGHNQRYFGHHSKAKELLDAGAIGDPFMIVASVHVHGHIEGFRRFLEPAGGGTLIDSGVHRFDLIRWIMGDVESVYAQTGRFMQLQMEGEDCAVVVMRFRNGAIGSFSCSWSAKVPKSEESLQIFGPRGAIMTEDHTRSLRLKSENPPSGIDNLHEFTFPIDQAESIRLEIRAFIESILREEPPPITGENGRAALELTIASYLSTKTGQAINLPLNA